MFLPDLRAWPWRSRPPTCSSTGRPPGSTRRARCLGLRAPHI